MGLVLLALVFASSASARTHPFIAAFGPDGTSGSSFVLPGAIGIDQSSEDVYVADLGTNSVYKFGPEGETRNFSSLGSNKLEGFGFRTNEPGTSEIAVNSATHDFYVASIGTNSLLAFHQDGTAAEFSALGSNEIPGSSEVCGVAVDSNGYIYVGDYGTVRIFKPTGDPVTSFPAASASGGVCNVAVDSTGSVYVNYYFGGVEKFVPSTVLPPTGSTTYSSAGVIDSKKSAGVSVDPATDDVYVDHGDAVAQYTANGAKIGASGLDGAGQLTESQGVAVQASTAKLFASDAASQQVKRYGPTTPEKPGVLHSWASGISATEATLHAEVVPDVETTYRFEYGGADCAVVSCSSTAEATLPEGGNAVAVSAELTGLAPHREYHFRLVAENASGTTFGPDATFFTFSPAPGANDGRAYEMVSPARDNSADLGVRSAAGGMLNGGIKVERAAADGERVSYESFTAFADPQAAPAASSYLSRRTSAGWITENITPPGSVSFGLIAPLRGFSPDLSFAAVVSPGQPLAAGALPAGYDNLYLRNNATGAYQALTSGPVAYASKERFCVNYIGASDDASHIIFTASGGLTADAPPPLEEAQRDLPYLYDWSPTGLKLVNVGPDGSPLVPTSRLGFGAGFDSCFADRHLISPNAISADGSTIFWTYAPGPFEEELFARLNQDTTIKLNENQGGSGPGYGSEYYFANVEGSRVFFQNENPLLPGSGSQDLYEYDLTSETLRDLTEGNTEPEGSRVRGFVAASDDGSYLYFVAEGSLAPGAVGGRPNLYLVHEGDIRHVATLLQATDQSNYSEKWFEKATRASSDGRYLIFQSTRRLTGYDNANRNYPVCSVDSSGQPRGDNLCMEVYRYDALTQSTLCISCNPDNSAPSTSPHPRKGFYTNELPIWTNPKEQPRFVSPQGSRVFFESSEQLTPEDVNLQRDVYSWEEPGIGTCSIESTNYSPGNEGCVDLISGGRSGDDSYFIDASVSGDDVFFSTREPLLRADSDAHFDIYDARVNGGFPETPPPPPGCEGEGCRGTGTQGGSGLGAGTAAFQGPGNVKGKAEKCRRGRVRRKGRCVKRNKAQHRRKRHHKKAGSADQHNRNASNGRAR